MSDKLTLFEEVLFELKEKSTEQSLVPKHPKLKRTIASLIVALARKNSFEEYELRNSAVSLAWEALNSFELVEGASWEGVVAGRDAHNLNRVIKAIIRKIEHELPVIANPNTKRMYDPETGGKVFVTVDFESLDRPVYDEQGEIVGTLVDEATESYFQPAHTYAKNPFLEWFREYRHEFLTARQNEFIDGLSSMTLKKDTDYVDQNDFEKLASMKTTDLDHMKKRIRERTLKAWAQHAKEKPELSRRGSFLASRIAEWRGFLAIADSDINLESQNVTLSEWIRDRETDRENDVVDFVYDLLGNDIAATQGFVQFLKGERQAIPSKVLYQIYEAVTKKVDRLRDELSSLSTVVPIKVIDHERRLRNADRQRVYKAFTGEQPCFVYNRDGELMRVMKSNLKEYKIKELSAFGKLYDKRDF